MSRKLASASLVTFNDAEASTTTNSNYVVENISDEQKEIINKEIEKDKLTIVCSLTPSKSAHPKYTIGMNSDNSFKKLNWRVANVTLLATRSKKDATYGPSMTAIVPNVSYRFHKSLSTVIEQTVSPDLNPNISQFFGIIELNLTACIVNTTYSITVNKYILPNIDKEFNEVLSLLNKEHMRSSGTLKPDHYNVVEKKKKINIKYEAHITYTEDIIDDDDYRHVCRARVTFEAKLAKAVAKLNKAIRLYNASRKPDEKDIDEMVIDYDPYLSAQENEAAAQYMVEIKNQRSRLVAATEEEDDIEVKPVVTKKTSKKASISLPKSKISSATKSSAKSSAKNKKIPSPPVEEEEEESEEEMNNDTEEEGSEPEESEPEESEPEPEPVVTKKSNKTKTVVVSRKTPIPSKTKGKKNLN